MSRAGEQVGTVAKAGFPGDRIPGDRRSRQRGRGPPEVSGGDKEAGLGWEGVACPTSTPGFPTQVRPPLRLTAHSPGRGWHPAAPHHLLWEGTGAGLLVDAGFCQWLPLSQGQACSPHLTRSFWTSCELPGCCSVPPSCFSSGRAVPRAGGPSVKDRQVLQVPERTGAVRAVL